MAWLMPASACTEWICQKGFDSTHKVDVDTGHSVLGLLDYDEAPVAIVYGGLHRFTGLASALR